MLWRDRGAWICLDHWTRLLHGQAAEVGSGRLAASKYLTLVKHSTAQHSTAQRHLFSIVIAVLHESSGMKKGEVGIRPLHLEFHADSASVVLSDVPEVRL